MAHGLNTLLYIHQIFCWLLVGVVVAPLVAVVQTAAAVLVV
jgi:hypothetical protein